MIIYKNNIIEFNILKTDIVYIKILNLNELNEVNIKYLCYIYSLFHIICYENNIKIKLVLNLFETNINILSIYNNVKIIVDALNNVKNLSARNVCRTFLLMNNSTKILLDLIFKIYSPASPIYLISNTEDIQKLM